MRFLLQQIILDLSAFLLPIPILNHIFVIILDHLLLDVIQIPIEQLLIINFVLLGVRQLVCTRAATLPSGFPGSAGTRRVPVAPGRGRSPFSRSLGCCALPTVLLFF
jgi:hypothetical protein